MVLLLLGRTGPYHVDRNSSIYWEMLYQSLATLVTQGEIEEEKLEGYEMNFYAPSKEELEEEVRKEGSFKVEMIEKFEQGIDIGSGGNRYSSYGQAVAKTVRSIQESMIAHHFGEGVLDKLFHQYAGLADREMPNTDLAPPTLFFFLQDFEGEMTRGALRFCLVEQEEMGSESRKRKRYDNAFSLS
ncbi:UNVERIFIED_CONTAM: Salicylate carboxymethyltransferase [Sesamum calycinum]|uniref:Salicylate carboxymethyltransferase n=1 Tax=Sesamum calycinum TaxID=2727403 RepID=A0AAW2MQV0_9LAMI